MPSNLVRFITALLFLLLTACGGSGGGGGSTPPPPVPIADADHDGVADNQDVAPNDPLCSAASDASGGKCYLRTLASSRLKLVGNSAGKIFFYSEEDSLRLYGYDLQTKHFTGRVDITGYTPTSFAYSPQHGRLYVGDTNGKIRCYSESLQPCSTVFATVSLRVMGLAAAGNYLLAQDEAGAWATHYVFDREGRLTDQKDWNRYSKHYEWSQSQSRMYFFRDDTSPNDLHYEVIDQSTGRITAAGETPYHGDYPIVGPIRVNAAGTRVLLGSGDVYDASALEWIGNLGGILTDAAWIASGETVTVSQIAGRTILRRFSIYRQKVEELPINGELLGIGIAGTTNHLIVKMADRVEMLTYVPSNDSDGDGFPNSSDKFPNDKTAAVDSDNDGYPDAFLGNYTAADSPTGLTRDAYPYDASCHAPEQGDGVNCSPALTNPAYTPDQIVGDEQGTIYLLSKANRRVFRWSAARTAYLSPIALNSTPNAALNVMAYSADHGRLYFGYDNGVITHANLAGDSSETQFSTIALAVGGLAATGNYLLAQDNSGAWASHYVLDRLGQVTDRKDWNYFSRHYDWSANQSRVYFFRDGTTPNDLHYETIDQATGKIISSGDSPYHGGYQMTGPIRVSLEGGRIALGSGNIYSPTDLTVVKSLGASFVDAQWLQDGSLVTLAQNGPDRSSITIYDESLSAVRKEVIDGAPRGLVRVPGGLVVVTQVGDRPQFMTFTR